MSRFDGSRETGREGGRRVDRDLNEPPLESWRDEPVRQRLTRISSRVGLAVAVVALIMVSGVAVGLRYVAPPRPAESAVHTTGHPQNTASSTLDRQTTGATAQTQTVHVDDWGLAFDYPARWQVVQPLTNMRYISVLAFLGTGTGGQICSPTGVILQCYSDIHLEPGQVMVRLSEMSSPVGGPFDAADSRWLGPGQDLTTVGGLPASYSESTRTGWYQSDLAMVWNLSAPGSIQARYEIDAYVRGPDVDVLRTEVNRLVASIHYDPGPVKLDPAEGPGVASVTLAELRATDPNGFCYPTGAGVSSQVVDAIFGVRLTKPLPVTCDVRIEPYVGLWKLTISMSWDAAPDRSPGSYTVKLFLTPGGQRTWSEATGSPMPYWPSV